MKRLTDVGAFLAGLAEGSQLVLHSACAEPRRLARELAAHAGSMRAARLYTLMPMGHAPYAEHGDPAHLDIATFFPGPGLRAALNAGRVHSLRHPLSDIGGLFEAKTLRADVLLLQTTAPDETGHVSLGLSVDYMHAVLAQSPVVVAEINPRMPWTCGNTRLHVSRIDWFVDAVDPPQEVVSSAADTVDIEIARNVAGLVESGATLQVGIGSLPDRVLAQLGHLRHLGVHTGIITGAMRPLIESGVVDNSRKQHFPGVSVATMACGPLSFYDFLHRNAAIELHGCDRTHDRAVLAGIDKLCAINSALQVDLEGNVNAETAGTRRVSMPGGLPDFAAGASLAPGGQSIIALRSSFESGTASNIVARFGPEAPLSVPHAHVDFVVTEHGVAALRGRDAAGRARALIDIAHPEHREALARAHASNGRLRLAA